MVVSKSIVVVDTPEYSVRLEYNEDYLILHLPHCKISKGVLLDMRKKLDEYSVLFKTLGQSPFVAGSYKDDTKTQKLLRLLGFEYRGVMDNGMFLFEKGQV